MPDLALSNTNAVTQAWTCQLLSNIAGASVSTGYTTKAPVQDSSKAPDKKDVK